MTQAFQDAASGRADPRRSALCGDPDRPLTDACFCLTLDQGALQSQAEAALPAPELAGLVHERWSHAFAEMPVFLSSAQAGRMAQVIAAIHEVAALPAWREQALLDAPEIARHEPRGAKGAFFGYDFHVHGDTAALIEINTNAGGALLNTLLARAQRACCGWIAQASSGQDAVTFEDEIVAMFRAEWEAGSSGRGLRSIAIVDREPAQQYLYPEFLLFQQLLRRHGIETVIADPSELVHGTDGLRWRDTRIDLVYNRLTDFYLEDAASAALRAAYLADAVVLTPHPQAHALLADKRRLAWLSDDARLGSMGVPQDTRERLLAAVPRTVLVTEADASQLWAERRRFFFKPVAGFGGRAAYRGDKVTRTVWNSILAGGYVAQALVEPGRRSRGAGADAMKFDVRNFVYDGRVQWLAARLYRGQTTNFRTEGGGFAPVYTLPDRLPQTSGCEYASYVFLLDEAGTIRPIPHALYVALARGEAVSPQLAGRAVRVADWYVRLRDGEPDAMVNEWYGWARFAEDGRFDPAYHGPGHAGDGRSGNVDVSALPSELERRQMMEIMGRKT